MIHVYTADLRERADHYSCYDYLGLGFAVARAVYHFQNERGFRLFHVIGFGQQGLDYAVHIRAEKR